VFALSVFGGVLATGVAVFAAFALIGHVPRAVVYAIPFVPALLSARGTWRSTCIDSQWRPAWYGLLVGSAGVSAYAQFLLSAWPEEWW